MKTIQQHFREADADDLVTQYLFKHPLTIDPATEFDDKITIKEAYERYKENLHKLIERIRTVECDDSHAQGWIFFVRHIAERDGSDIECVLMKEEEIQTEDMPFPYAYELTPVAETACIPVVDTYLTMRYLDEVLLDYMYEASWFGYEQEDLPAARAKLEAATQACDDFDVETVNTDASNTDEQMLKSREELFEEFGYTPEMRNPEEKKAYDKLLVAMQDYQNIATRIEIRNVLESLKN